MASHNSTPKSVLEAPVLSPAILEGTEFTGLNRAQLRARGHRGDSKPLHGRMAARKKAPNELLAEIEAARLAALQETLDSSSDVQPVRRSAVIES